MLASRWNFLRKFRGSISASDPLCAKRVDLQAKCWTWHKSAFYKKFSWRIIYIQGWAHVLNILNVPQVDYMIQPELRTSESDNMFISMYTRTHHHDIIGNPLTNLHCFVIFYVDLSLSKGLDDMLIKEDAP